MKDSPPFCRNIWIEMEETILSIFQRNKEKSLKLKQVKFIREIEKNYEAGLYGEASKAEIIENNSETLKNVLKNDIIKDLVDWFNSKIDNQKSDRIKKIAEWINIWTLYLNLEENFDSEKLRKYERGDIVHINFGFNVGAELGGSHYGIVIEKNNDKSNQAVIVVPLRSEDGELKEELVNNNLNKYEVLLGKNLIPLGEAKNNYSIAKVNQIRAISKLRITVPKKDSDTVYPIDDKIRNEILDKIDEEIKKILIK